MKMMSICPHTIRVIEDWAGKKTSPRNQTVMNKTTVEVKEEDEDGVPLAKKSKNVTSGGNGENDEKSPGGDRTPLRVKTSNKKNRLDGIARATLPNKSTVFVRTLKNEVPCTLEDVDPHSPLAIVSPSIIPRDFKIQKKGLTSAKKHVSHSLGYNSIY